MSLVQTPERLQLPESLEAQLHEFRRRVWSIKMVEAACGAVFGVMVGFLAMFAIDRVLETPDWVRTALFAVVVTACALVPLALHRWVWGQRKLEQLARLLTRRHPHIGDQLLGIIELAHSDAEQARSRVLCQAAIEQVAEAAHKRDFRDAVPNPRHRLWAGLMAVPTLAALALTLFVPAAASNAWARLMTPWNDIPRYTFASVGALPERIVVAHGEPFTLTIPLAENSASQPGEAIARLGSQEEIAAPLKDGAYQFEFPGQIDPAKVQIRVGDAWLRTHVEPRLRPELSTIVADVKLPEYLGRPEPQHRDVRGGQISLVNSSIATFTATASRDLQSADVDGEARVPSGTTVSSQPVAIKGAATVRFEWRDDAGLAGREPFVLTITGRDDEAPSITCEDLPRQKVVLDSETLNFKVRARDDFGVKQVGIEWHGVGETLVKSPAEGEKLLSAGGHDREALEVAGTFSARTLGIEPQPIEVRLFVEDYLPGRERVYSPAYTLYVLSPEQHAIWLTEQLSKWHRHALEVRDREMQLFETNKALRELSTDELDRPDTRKRIDAQASAEKANGRRLSQLVNLGEDLVKQATRNPEFGVGHLETWAEMLQILKDISANRMPSVADLLKQASQSPGAVAEKKPSAPQAGQNRSTAGGAGSKPAEDPKKPKPAVPSIVDGESSHGSGKKPQPPSDNPAKPSNPRLTLPVTTVVGAGGANKPKPPSPAEEKVDEAVKQQQDLLAEFEKITDELNRVLANLEGSTLVKRLKAQSRLQYSVAGRISDRLTDTFGAASIQVGEESSKVLTDMTKQEAKSSNDVSIIMDDMHAYFERRRFAKFKSVLDEMRELDVVGGLRTLGDELKKENGISIAQAEFWSDTLDRWAEDLVDPACKGCCPGCKSKGSLPPSIVLEVLQILEAEVNLREETRVAEQARKAVAADEYQKQATQLSKTQDELEKRVIKVVERILELPDAQADFGKEIALLNRVAVVMKEATGILASPDTGAPAIAAETEAIELLLQSKRINPKAGGGGGSNPGGGGKGDTQDSALTLLGVGANEKEVREDHGISQSAGEAGDVLPEEFRAGLDEYFNRLERGSGGN